MRITLNFEAVVLLIMAIIGGLIWGFWVGVFVLVSPFVGSLIKEVISAIEEIARIP